uniref:Uncharacterized protein n=2 Tax=Emiliania huxleyi TaxID=2903 RepID=A0A7S3RS63_EMIHU|mmetsp:Transcript_29824/g.88662  ORF Transcript_29824/g.88662 Transcript_29824/m.88662 type:complete len:276 (+) Transcript_29824:653-1480(+)
MSFCANSVNVDWWWIGDAALADGFHETYDDFARYSRLIRNKLGFHNSAPHHYWGLYFFTTMRLRQRCQLGFAAHTFRDFNLGRFVKPGRGQCALPARLAIWRPPTGCNASAVSGYDVMCPIATTHPGCHNRNPLASQPSGVCGEPVEVQCGEQQPAAMSAAARAAHAQTPRPECLSALGASASRLYSRSSNEAVRHKAAAWLTRYRCNENNSQTRTPEAAPFAQLMGRTSVSKGGPVPAHTQKRTIFEALHRRRGSTPRNISWTAELRAAWTGVG